MSTLELKKLLVSKIDEINDIELLKAVYKLLDFSSKSESVYHFSREEKIDVELGIQQVKDGNTIPDDEIQKEIELSL